MFGKPNLYCEFVIKIKSTQLGMNLFYIYIFKLSILINTVGSKHSYVIIALVFCFCGYDLII